MVTPRRADHHAATPGGDDGIRVPEVEERVRVETRVVRLGEARFRRRVTEEVGRVEVDVARERVRVTRRSVAQRSATPAERESAFEPGTTRFPVFGEAAEARKAPFVTGEVVVRRRRVRETRTITEQVRRQRVEVEAPPVVHEETAPVERAPARAVVARSAGVPAADTEATRAEAPRPAVPSLPSLPALPSLPSLPPLPPLPIRRVLDEVRAGWSRARAAAAQGPEGGEGGDDTTRAA